MIATVGVKATKTALAQQIVSQISIKGILTVRTAKYVITNETTFRGAVDWIAATVQGVDDASTLRECILDRYPEYYELFDTMHSRVSTRDQQLKTDQAFHKADTENEDNCSSDESDAGSNQRAGGTSKGSTPNRSKTIPISIAQSQTKKIVETMTCQHTRSTET